MTEESKEKEIQTEFELSLIAIEKLREVRKELSQIATLISELQTDISSQLVRLMTTPICPYDKGIRPTISPIITDSSEEFQKEVLPETNDDAKFFDFSNV